MKERGSTVCKNAEFLGHALFSYGLYGEFCFTAFVCMVKKLYSLCENHLFSKAYRKGRCDANKYVAVYALKNYEKTPSRSFAPTRLGITVNKKLGGAVRRSRVKRMIRAAYRENMPLLKNGYLVIVAARGAVFDKSVKSTAVAEKMRTSFEKLGLLVGTSPQEKRK